MYVRFVNCGICKADCYSKSYTEMDIIYTLNYLVKKIEPYRIKSARNGIETSNNNPCLIFNCCDFYV